MRTLIFVMIILLAGTSLAADLGSHSTLIKDNSHVGQNPGTPQLRQGGEFVDTAVLIETLPYETVGTTAGYLDDFDVSCPYSGSISPDVFYRFTPNADINLNVDLCGSLYDTKTYVLDENLMELACNDDAYFDDICGNYVSLIEGVALVAGQTVYIGIDGYGGDSGDYVLSVSAFILPEPCDLVCNGVEENEPPLVDGYIDMHNPGCGAEAIVPVFTEFEGDGLGELVFCGVSGWYDEANRDTDWFTAVIGNTHILHELV